MLVAADEIRLMSIGIASSCSPKKRPSFLAEALKCDFRVVGEGGFGERKGTP